MIISAEPMSAKACSPQYPALRYRSMQPHPATLAAFVSMVEADFFFFPPIYSFRVEDPQEAIDLLLFLVVALVSGNLASRLRQETKTLRQRERDIHTLYDFSRRLVACFTLPELISAIEY